MDTDLAALVKDLKLELDVAEMLHERRAEPVHTFSGPAAMVLRIEPLKFKMYQEKGHSLPHLHIDYGKIHHVASYSIDPVERLEGQLSHKYDFAVLAWIRSNKDRLLQLWHRMQAGQDGTDIIRELRHEA